MLERHSLLTRWPHNPPKYVLLLHKHRYTWAGCRSTVIGGWHRLEEGGRKTKRKKQDRKGSMKRMHKVKTKGDEAEKKEWWGTRRRGRRGVRESGTPAYFPRVKPGVSCEPDSSDRLPLPGTALSLLIPACPEATWAGSRAAASTGHTVWSRLIQDHCHFKSQVQ